MPAFGGHGCSMKLILNSGHLPKGFLATGLAAGLRRRGRRDLGLLYSSAPCAAAALFTSNEIQAAPLVVSRRHLGRGKVRALIVNSGNANCMTGIKGIRAAQAMASAAAAALRLKPSQVLVASTGIIGRQLPIERVVRAVPKLADALSGRGLSRMAEAIRTTDTFSKEVLVSLSLGGRRVTVSGIAKGAGMIAPRMRVATMLSFIVTDAAVAQGALKKALADAVAGSFNAITVDGCMSTNDTVVALANGQAGNRTITARSRDYGKFLKALREVAAALARMIVKDGEGATKFITIDVKRAASDAEAEGLAFGVANSVLFKTAMFGSNPNWGRIAAALGSVGARLDWQKMTIVLNGVPVFRKGRPVALKKRGILKGRDIGVVIDLAWGRGAKRVWTSDLSYGYVRINAEYN